MTPVTLLVHHAVNFPPAVMYAGFGAIGVGLLGVLGILAFGSRQVSTADPPGSMRSGSGDCPSRTVYPWSTSLSMNSRRFSRAGSLSVFNATPPSGPVGAPFPEV